MEINLYQTQFCCYIVSNEIDSDGKIVLNWVICTPSHLQHNHSLGHVLNPANVSILFERMQLFLQCKQSIYHFCLFALISGRLISIHMQQDYFIQPLRGSSSLFLSYVSEKICPNLLGFFVFFLRGGANRSPANYVCFTTEKPQLLLLLLPSTKEVGRTLKKKNNISTYSWCSMITLCTSEFNVFRVVFLFLFLKTLNEKQQEKSKTNPCRKKRLKSDAKARKTENKPERLNQCVNLPQSASQPIN